MAINKTDHLDCVLSSHKIQKETVLLNKHIEKKGEIKDALKEQYGSGLYDPFNSGSYAKHTAVNSKFDFDLIAPFKRNAFDTLKKMYEDVYDFLYEKYKSEATIKKQKVSIGLEFHADADGHVVNVDVVPGRELNLDQYLKDENINLYVYSQYGSIDAGSERIKTNPKAQISNIKNQAEKDSIRHIIKLLKIWKVQNHGAPKSFFLELITIKAFDSEEISGDTWDQLKGVIEFIRDNVEKISLSDPGNSNNEVADTLTKDEKKILSGDLKHMLERIDENSDNIKLYFKSNENHPCSEKRDDKNKYGIKESGISSPPAARFG